MITALATFGAGIVIILALLGMLVVVGAFRIVAEKSKK
jgi:hypothetical protein